MRAEQGLKFLWGKRAACALLYCSVGECVQRPSDLEEFLLHPVCLWSVSLGVTGDCRLCTWQTAEVNRTKDGKTNKGKTLLKDG